MDNFPKLGMKFEQGRGRARRFAKGGNVRVVNSLINQVTLAEGSKAANELAREINMDYAKKNNVGKKYY